jgi:hypothetical protein
MRILFLIIGMNVILASCQNDKSEHTENLNGTHKVVVKDVLQSTNYTYLLVTENNTENWLAVPKMNADKGETYYYDNGMLMENFMSKDLKRTFEKIYFLDEIRTTLEKKNGSINTTDVPRDMKPKIDKKDMQLSKVDGGISIKDLFSEKSKYDGKTVKVKGVVSKVNPEIMGKNWIHIQDGTDFEGQFDLTVTSKFVPNVGDTIIVEGIIALNKDFGAGYIYDVILEDAQIKMTIK